MNQQQVHNFYLGTVMNNIEGFCFFVNKFIRHHSDTQLNRLRLRVAGIGGG